MEQKNSQTAAMLRGDILMLGIFLAVLLGVNGFILTQTLPLLAQRNSGVLIVPFVSAILVLSGTLINVGVHLYQNRDVLYREEQYYRDMAQKKAGKEE